MKYILYEETQNKHGNARFHIRVEGFERMRLPEYVERIGAYEINFDKANDLIDVVHSFSGSREELVAKINTL